MGDFVSKKASSSSKTEVKYMRDLWDDTEDKDKQNQQLAGKPGIIRDFALVSDENILSDLNHILPQWLEWIGENSKYT